MAKNNKFYVVWKGLEPGVYSSWEECKKQIDNFKGAQYKSFPSKKEAEEAFQKPFSNQFKKSKNSTIQHGPSPNLNSISVDAASSGNPGIMEYQGVDTGTKQLLFKQGPFPEGTNNIGEFLAIVHGLAFLKKKNSSRIIYTDSKTAMTWVRKKKCNTKLKVTSKNKELFDLIDRAENWLTTNTFQTKIEKWETKIWGEIPADFGRK
ncbi:ribonuclease H1 domain-containing protein [Aegicerativicinus sediminis]